MKLLVELKTDKDTEIGLLELGSVLREIARNLAENESVRNRTKHFNYPAKGSYDLIITPEKVVDLSEAQKVAERLHEKLCHWNHTDGCGWMYEAWTTPGYSKKDYLKKAKNMLQIADNKIILELIEEL